MLCHLIQNMLSNIGAELAKDGCKVVEMRELNNTEKLTSQVLLIVDCCLAVSPGALACLR